MNQVGSHFTAFSVLAETYVCDELVRWFVNDSSCCNSFVLGKYLHGYLSGGPLNSRMVGVV